MQLESSPQPWLFPFLWSPAFSWVCYLQPCLQFPARCLDAVWMPTEALGLPGWALYQPSVSYTRLNPSLSWSLPFWAYPLSNTSSGSAVSSSFPLCESLFLQPILVSAFPRLPSLVQATSILALKKTYWPLNSYSIHIPQPQPDSYLSVESWVTPTSQPRAFNVFPLLKR